MTHKIDYSKISKIESTLISRIADRACTLVHEYGEDTDKLSVEMDMTTAHFKLSVEMAITTAHLVCPLKLEEILATKSDSDFAHDVFGIRLHLNYERGCFNDGFLPRFSV